MLNRLNLGKVLTIKICPVCGRKIKINQDGNFTGHHEKKPTRKGIILANGGGIILVPPKFCLMSWKTHVAPIP